MKFIKNVFLFLTVISSYKTFGQVTLQTGSATFSLPMFNWQDSKSRLNSMVALDYNSGNGLKVNDVASNVGQGWNMATGGIITRIQVGEPDDQKPREGAVEDITKYPPGYLYNNVNPALGSPTALNKYPIFGDQNHVYKQHNLIAADRELDYFAFQFNGRNGMFVLDKNTNEGVSLGDTKIKISFTRNEVASSWGFRTTIRLFTIQDESGLIYRFGNINNSGQGNFYLGRTKVLKTSYCSKSLSQELTQPKFKDEKVYNEAAFDDNTTNPYIINGWYLAEIEDALTGRKIYYNYAVRNINAAAGVDISHYFSDKNYVLLSHKTSVTVTPEISSIIYPDGHNVVFNYGDTRADLNGDLALASVDVKYNGRYLSKYQLNTSYFILNRYGTPISDYQKRVARLCLLSVIKYGVDLKASERPYNFDYYLGSSSPDDFIPPPFFYAKDIWGYYNGDNSRNASNSPVPLNTSIEDLGYNDLKGLCFLRDGTSNSTINAKAGYAKNGLLKQVVYPTGGALTYEYSQNIGSLARQSSNVGGVHVSKTKLTDGGYSNGCDNPIVTNFNYTLEGSGQSSLWGIEMPVNYSEISSHYEPEYKYYHYKFPFGTCSYHYQYPGILSKDQSASISNSQKTMATVSKILNIVGTITTILDVANLIGGATGVMAWASVIMDIIGGLVEIVLTCFINQSKDSTTTVYYNSDINGINPLPTQFKRVEIIRNSGIAGKTVQEFTSDEDYDIWEPANSVFSMKQRFAPWAYGLPKKVTDYNANGDPVKQTENTYNWMYAKRSFDFFHSSYYPYRSCKSLVLKTYSQRNTDWSDANFYNPQPDGSYITESNDDVKVEIYTIFSGRVELNATSERVFKQNSSTQYSETSTAYSYNLLYLPSSIETTQSNGNRSVEEIRYSGDFNWSHDPALSLLNLHNIISIPIVSTTRLVKSNQYYYLNERVTEFDSTLNGDIKPHRTIEQRFSEPKTSQNFHAYIEPNNPSNPPYRETQLFTYDGSGNLIGMKDEGNHTISNIYDYDDKYVIASVINAEPLIDKPAYTSFETTETGGWLLNGSASYITGGVTGNRSIVLGSSNLSAQLNTAKTYRLSFWSNNNNVTISGGATTILKSAPVINGFTYYEYEVTQGTSGIIVSGNATIDELRLCPKTARMRTVSYDPLIGKTSECDENNRITYYEYDDLSRLRFIKDESRNIVKMYEYNTTGKQGGCPSTYYNHYTSEIFVKNNCSAGYVGNKVIYEVPAGKYSSTISQYDADMKVQNEVNSSGQNYANTHGSCAQLYYNTAQSESFNPQSCPIGFTAPAVTYSVAAGTYSSVTPGEADAMALEEIKANGQAYANTHASCTLNSDPVWEADAPAQTQCQSGHLLVLITDVNPNSNSFNSTQWVDLGPNTAECPTTQSCKNYRIEVPNDISENLYIVYTRCDGGIIVDNWNMMPHDIGTSPNSSQFTIPCLQSVPNFRYGPTGDLVHIPEIIVTELTGDCLSPSPN